MRLSGGVLCALVLFAFGRIPGPATADPGGGSEPFRLISAAGSGGGRIVTLTFSEPLGAGAVGGYTLDVYGVPMSRHAIRSAHATGATVELEVYGWLQYDTTYQVRVTGARDVSGNPILEGTSITFYSGPIPAVVDPIPPRLVHANGLGGSYEVSVLFSEAVGEGATDLANYHLTRGTGAAAAQRVLLDAEANGAIATLTTREPLDAGIEYALQVSDVRDRAGNVITAGSTVTFRPPASLPSWAERKIAFAMGFERETWIDVGLDSGASTGSEGVANYALVPVGFAAPRRVTAAIPGGDRVRLLLDGPLVRGDVYRLSMSGVVLFAPGGRGEVDAAPAAEATSTVQFTVRAAIPLSPVLALDGHVGYMDPPCAGKPHIYRHCSEYVTEGTVGNRYEAYLVIASPLSPDGIAAVRFGIACDADVAVYSFAPCATGVTLSSGGFPASGGASLVFWTGDQACEGYPRSGAGTLFGDALQATAG